MAVRRDVNDRIMLLREFLIDIWFYELLIHEFRAPEQFLKAAHFPRHVLQGSESLHPIRKAVYDQFDFFLLEWRRLHQSQSWRHRNRIFLDKIFLSVMQRSHRDVAQRAVGDKNKGVDLGIREQRFERLDQPIVKLLGLVEVFVSRALLEVHSKLMGSVV